MQLRYSALVGFLVQAVFVGSSLASSFQRVSWHDGFESQNVNLQWEVTRGLWAFGKSAIGPTNAFTGAACAATGLRRDTPYTGNSSLISPPVTIPPATERPRLRFWQWFMIHPDHSGQVSVLLEDGTQQSLSPKFNGQSPVWTPAALDLSKYGGQTVRFSFDFGSYADGAWPGWFIDEVEVVSGGFLFQGFDNFDAGWGDWSASRGNWSVGQPALGPKAAFSGSSCAAVTLEGGRLPIYPISSSLVSPPVAVPAASQEPRLHFWHWFQIHPDHSGQVRIRLEDGTEEALSPSYNGQAPGWTPASLDLSKYAGRTVQVLFSFSSYVDGAWPGWFIDDVELQTTPGTDFVARTEDFEGGWGEWSAERGNWFVGSPTIGPQAASSGVNCAAVALQGDKFPIYPISSALLSPRFLVPGAGSNPRLTFQHWFKIHPDHHGQVFIRLDDGTEEALSTPYNGDSSGWTTALLPLSKYAGKMVRFRFFFSAYVDGAWPGWFIDDVRVIPAVPNARPQFDLVQPQLARALEKLEFRVKATDTDAAQSLTYSMDTNTAPSTAQFDPASATFSWSPTVGECANPGYNVTFSATDNGAPPLRATLVVPVLGIVPDGSAQAGGIAPSLILADRRDYAGWRLRLVGGLRGFSYTLQNAHDLSLPWSDVLTNLVLEHDRELPQVLAPTPIADQGQTFFRLRANLSQPAP